MGPGMVEAPPTLTSYSDALNHILEASVALGTVVVRLENASGHVLTSAIATPFDIPRFDNSAVDGFAIGAEDLSELQQSGVVRLSCTKCIAAGDSVEECTLSRGHAIQIFTGAETPGGTAAIVMQEDTRFEDGIVTITGTPNLGQHVRKQGDECLMGQVVFEAGTVLSPGAVALIAELGFAEINAAKRPQIGLVSTGNELTSPGEPLNRGAIYDSNSFGLRAALNSAGIFDIVTKRTPDEFEATRDAFQELLETCDVVVSFGGVSVGEFDLVKPVLKELGVATSIWGTRLKPGKPFYFGLPSSNRRCKAVFGLPGNPLSALVTSQLFLFPYLRRMQGIDRAVPEVFAATLLKDLSKHTDRLEFVPGRLKLDERQIGFEPADLRGSHMLTGFSSAQALGMFEVESMHMKAGGSISVMCICWELNIDA